MEQQERKTVFTIGEIAQEFMQKMSTPEGREEIEENELSFRRGWHHGWDYACSVIFGKLLASGIPVEQANQIVCDFENTVVMEWRRSDVKLFHNRTPHFCLEDFKPTDTTPESEVA